MPIFEYRCSACGHLEEVLQKHSDPAPGTCPKCQASSTMSKELSLSAFHLKGGGWYKDLYASSSSPSSADSPSTASTASTPAQASTAAPAPAPAASAPAAPAPAAAPAPSAAPTTTAS